jgi:hypothetical protein
MSNVTLNNTIALHGVDPTLVSPAAIYHLRPHSSTGISPQFRFAQAAGSLRHLDGGLELEPLFFTRIKRTVRKNGTVRIDGVL